MLDRYDVLGCSNSPFIDMLSGCAYLELHRIIDFIGCMCRPWALFQDAVTNQTTSGLAFGLLYGDPVTQF